MDKPTTFDCIMIFRKPGEDAETQRVAEIVYSYGKSRGIPTTFWYPDSFDERVLIVSVGGDGTMLGALRASVNYKNSTVLGLNTGTLGFLTEEIPHNLNKYLDDILYENDVILEKRMILEGQYSINGEGFEEPFKMKAMNEFVVNGNGINAPLITEVFINEHFVSKQLGSGVLVSSSTGSTAMTLSAGGAIVSPSTNIMQVVPLIPHTLTSRPVITTGRDVITIRIELTDRVPRVDIIADGQPIFTCTKPVGTIVEFRVRKHPQEVKIWRPKNWNFFNVLTEKMKW